MKVLIISHEYPPFYGGGAYITYHLINQLSKKNIEIHLLTKGRAYDKNKNIKFYLIKPLFEKSKFQGEIIPTLYFIIKGILLARQIIKKEKPNIINAHFSFPAGIVGCLAKDEKSKFIISAMGADIYDNTRKLVPSQNFVLKKINQCVLNKASKIIVLSSDIKEKIRNIYKYEGDIRIIPPGIASIEFPKKNKKDFGFNEDDFILITIGRLVKRKRIPDLLFALENIDNKIKLIVIGDGPEKNKIMNLIERLDLKDRVFIKGYISEEEKFQLLSISDIFVMVSEYEAFGIAYLEAMTVGLPVIATNAGGPRDFIEEGKNGFIIPVGDIRALRTCIISLLNDKNKRIYISNYNKEYIKNNYTIEKFAEKYMEIFNEE